jgi:hypothetical protein
MQEDDGCSMGNDVVSLPPTPKHAAAVPPPEPDTSLVTFKNEKCREKKYWQFIELVAPRNRPTPMDGWTNHDATHIYCLKCHKKYVFRMGSSQSVKHHMESKHMDELLEYEKREKELVERRKSWHGTTTTSDDDAIVRIPPAKKQKVRHGSKFEKVSLTSLCAEWVRTSVRPVGMMEDTGLHQIIMYVQGFDTNNILPSRATVTRKIAEMGQYYK